MSLCYAAGRRRLFVGVESANEESLRETRKRQNLLMPIRQAVERASGMSGLGAISTILTIRMAERSRL